MPSSSSKSTVLSPGMQVMLRAIGSPLQSPFCARTYIVVLGGFAGSRTEQALKQNDTAVLELFKRYLTFLLLLEDPTPALEHKLFHQPCQCVIYPEFAHFHQRASNGDLVSFMPELRGGQKSKIDNMQTFVEALCDLLDMILALGIQAHHESIPKSRAWWRELKDVVRAHSPSFARTFCKWLKRSASCIVFAFFGTILEIQGSDGLAISSVMDVPRSLETIDERLFALVSEQQAQTAGKQPQAHSEIQPLDLVYHGAGCFALAIVTMHTQTSKREQVVAYISSGARRRYESLCALLQLVPYTCTYTQTGRAQDIIRLTVFAQKHEPLFPESPSLLIAKLAHQWIPDSDRVAIATIFGNHLCMIDRCHNVSAHATSTRHKTASQAIVAGSEYVPKGQRLSACTGCLVARYCSMECQKADWKKGDPPHKSICASLKKLRLIQKGPGQSGPEGARWIESEYDAFSAEDFDKLVRYLFEMSVYFSEQPLPEHLVGVFDNLKLGT